MQKETETEETIVFFVTFLSLVTFQLGGPEPPGAPSSYAYDWLSFFGLAASAVATVGPGALYSP